MEIDKITLPVARKMAGLTQKMLAQYVGVSESTVLCWEKGKREPSVSQAIAISQATNIPYDSIIFCSKSTDKP